jgi:predicted extracellular nuclease
MGGAIEFEAVNERPAAPEDVGGDLKVASFNVLNYFNTFNDFSTAGHECAGGVAGAPMECRGADDAEELERQADKIVAAITGLDADVVGVIEIENDGYGPDSALQDLVNRLNEAEGAGTYSFIDVDERTGQVDALGDDAIKVGLLYKPATAQPVARTAVLNTDSFVNDANGEPSNRPALAQMFRDDDGGRVTVVVNHLKSKGSDCEPADPDRLDGQGNCNQTRTDAATELAEWLATSPNGQKDPDVLIMGDLNAYAMEDPIRALEAAGYTNLVRDREGEDAYSYVFDGQWGYLDHALGSETLLGGQVTGVTTWHINADEPNVLDYNTDFKSPGQVESLYAPTPYRSSDHDPVLVGLDLTAD